MPAVYIAYDVYATPYNTYRVRFVGEYIYLYCIIVVYLLGMHIVPRERCTQPHVVSAMYL